MRHPAANFWESASKIEPLGNRNPAIVSQVRISPAVGLWSKPPEEAAQAKKRLGKVGPGIEANQPSHKAKFLARAFRTRSWSALKHLMMSPNLLEACEA